MSLAIVYSRANIGIEAPLVTVETHLSSGLPGFSIVGLPETAVKESKERVRSAILNSRLEFPAKRITVNLAPADLPKTGGRFDLAIAVGILAASGQLDTSQLGKLEFMGELALSGELRPVPGILPGLMAGRDGQRHSIIPRANAEEAALLQEQGVSVCEHLLELVKHLKGDQTLAGIEPLEPVNPLLTESLDDVVGQEQAQRALLIAAAGGHNLLMRGPPGTGKTMLANRLPSILPPLEIKAALEVAALRSIAGLPCNTDSMHQAPFRAPHHTASAVALVGGGRQVNAGEISLAHGGVLFLDELPEFSRHVLEVLREPIESGSILISRAAYQTRLPASFQLVAAMNPCPCGYYGDSERDCRCTPDRIRQYQQRISGPLLDRIDIHIDLQRLGKEERKLLLQKKGSNNKSKQLRKQVSLARERQLKRAGKLNAHLNQAEIKRYCRPAAAGRKMLEQAMEQLKLSTRAYFRILKVARSIADLNNAAELENGYLLEAVAYRKFDRQDC
ncbi:MAG: ATP-dependent protease [Gammaproteobacteria bacterium]|nr:ATP-dependent protease [Gammaproteobacteria bacterium]|tara:strand:+ start:305429 stop:306943 length:1515 start_codon:yes stop_codon:yes gene_type:complete